MTPCRDFIGEALIGDSEQYLGDFRNVYDPGAPATSADGHDLWPVGWTANGYFNVRHFAAGIPIFTASATGAQHLAVTGDTTGPTDLEGVAAAEILFSGDTGSGMVFMGEGPAFDSGITVAPGDCWYASVWAKAVPDADDFLATGYTIDLKMADPADVGNNLGVTAWDTDHDLTADWAYYAGRIQWVPPYTALDFAGFVNAQFGVLTQEDNADVPKGAMEVKCAHLYPCEAKTGPYGIRTMGVTRVGAE